MSDLADNCAGPASRHRATGHVEADAIMQQMAQVRRSTTQLDRPGLAQTATGAPGPCRAS
jgi:hypothetical protein